MPFLGEWKRITPGLRAIRKLGSQARSNQRLWLVLQMNSTLSTVANLFVADVNIDDSAVHRLRILRPRGLLGGATSRDRSRYRAEPFAGASSRPPYAQCAICGRHSLWMIRVPSSHGDSWRSVVQKNAFPMISNKYQQPALIPANAFLPRNPITTSHLPAIP